MTREESQRLRENYYVIEYFNQEITSNIPTPEDISYILCESIKTLENDQEKHPTRNLRERKQFFKSLLEEDPDQIEIKKTKKRRTQSTKLR